MPTSDSIKPQASCTLARPWLVACRCKDADLYWCLSKMCRNGLHMCPMLLIAWAVAVSAVDDLSSFLSKQRAGNDIAPGISAAVMKVNSKTGAFTLLAQGRFVITFGVIFTAKDWHPANKSSANKIRSTSGQSLCNCIQIVMRTLLTQVQLGFGVSAAMSHYCPLTQCASALSAKASLQQPSASW